MMPASRLQPQSIDWVQLRQIFDRVPTRISMYDRDHRCIYVNTEWCTSYGMAKETVLGRTIADRFGEAAYAEVSQLGERAMAGEVVEWESWTVSPPMGRRYVRRTFTALRDSAGAVEGYFVFSHNLTGQRQTEHDLAEQSDARRASEALSASIIGVAIDCIITIDGTGRVVEFNPTAERTFGHAGGRDDFPGGADGRRSAPDGTAVVYRLPA